MVEKNLTHGCVCSEVKPADVKTGLPGGAPVDTSTYSRNTDPGKASSAILIYLLTFSVCLFLFLRGYHTVAFAALIGVWAVLSLWLRGRGGY
jgi:hypothetical protein